MASFDFKPASGSVIGYEGPDLQNATSNNPAPALSKQSTYGGVAISTDFEKQVVMIR